MGQNNKKITGILLSGGKSSRMGREKGSIRIGDKLMYQYPLGILESLCDEILISTCDKTFIEEDHEKICDEIQGIGPIGGIYTCLKRSSNQINIVLSYDLPVVSKDLFLDLLPYAAAYDIVLPAMTKDRPEPLCGIYSKNAVVQIEEQIRNQLFAVHRVLPRLNSKIMVLDSKLPYFHPELFLNINSEDDLGKLNDI